MCMILLKRQNYRDKNKIDQWVSGTGSKEESTGKKHKGILEGNQTMLHLDCNGSNTIVCLSKLT